jgi:hypothetical protein
MTPNRIVAVLTPLVFAPLSGAVATWIADRVPGIEITDTELTGIFVGGALIALAPALQWLHGWQKFEAREAEIQRAVEVAHASAAPAALSASEVDDEFDDEFDDEYDDEFDDEYDAYGDEYDAYGDEYDAYGDDHDYDDDGYAQADLAGLEEPATAGS